MGIRDQFNLVNNENADHEVQSRNNQLVSDIHSYHLAQEELRNIASVPTGCNSRQTILRVPEFPTLASDQYSRENPVSTYYRPTVVPPSYSTP